MSTRTDEIKAIFNVVGAAIQGVETIGDAARAFLAQIGVSTPDVSGIEALLNGIEALLNGIIAISDAVKSGIDKPTTVADITAAGAALQASIASNNAAVDASVDARFPK
ncbi:MAG: hypothetical protein WA418_24555 [Bradyrhizobium sp.]